MNVAVNMTPAELAYGGLMLPHGRMEDWRWTNLRTLIDRPYPPRQMVVADPKDVTRLLASSPVAKIASARIVFVNGAFAADHSRLPASSVVTLEARMPNPRHSDEPLIALNTAFATDGLTISIGAGANVDTPIELVFIATAAEPRTVATRIAIEIAPGASATIIETHLGEAIYLANSTVSVTLGERARLDRIKLSLDSADGTHLADCHVTIGGGAILRDFTLMAGARRQPPERHLSFCRRTCRCAYRRRLSLGWPPACRHALAGQPRRPPLHQPRNLQMRDGRPRARCLSG